MPPLPRSEGLMPDTGHWEDPSAIGEAYCMDLGRDHQ